MRPEHVMLNHPMNPFSRSSSSSRRRLAAVAAMAGLALVPSAIAGEIVNVRSRTAKVTATEGSHGARMLSNAFRTVAEQVRPSVVQIVTIDEPPYQGADGGPNFDLDRIPEQFRDMMPNRPSPESQGPRMGQGTGVIATSDGMIITNNHVVQNADRVKVVLHDGTELPGTIIGTDPATDIAVLKIDRDGLVAASFADSDQAQVGDWVVALGSPYGLTQTVTAGIISAKGREAVGLARFENYIQTDAAINPGNSGGPLVNLDGDVVGINTAISSRGGGNDGIGFAIPSRMVERIANDLAGDGTVERGWLGVNIQTLEDPELAASFGAAARQGVLVSGVLDGTPASEAGLEPGDIITSIEGRATDTPATLARTVANHAPEDRITLEIVRNGENLVRTVILGTRPDDASAPGTRKPTNETSAPPRLGLEVVPLDEDLREQANLRTERGVFVGGVEAEGPAAKAGIEPGDAILRLNGTDVDDLESFKRTLDEIPEDKPVRMLIERTGTTRFVLIKVRD